MADSTSAGFDAESGHVASNMIGRVPQDILDGLTRVEMPRVRERPPADKIIQLDGYSVPVYECHTLVLGSGAAGMRAAVELRRRGLDVLVASTGYFSGTSACSGSDKQTLHTAGTDFHGDDFIKLAEAIRAGGAMDHDAAYVEATGSLEGLLGLTYMGLPIPRDSYGNILRYQTDHDEVGRATSCGPRTSRLMVKVLFEEALRLGIPFLGGCEGIQILKNTVAGEPRVSGVLALHNKEERNKFGLIAIRCRNLVIATGGPGELFRDSVYPRHCYGGLGLALEAGLILGNLTEQQFGIGTPRDQFPWNLSGTYMQVMPDIYSVDEAGMKHHFLSRYYRTTRELSSNIFRKGYQWPFHATRMKDFGSSLLDLAVYREGMAGRKVYLDFLHNPHPISGEDTFSLQNLDADVVRYLDGSGAMQDLPIDRLRQMNPLAIELFKMHGYDIATEPLEFMVNHQHMNGGIEVDIWGRTSLQGCYAVGEAAGTHGVTRPGGAALNAGQVYGLRCAMHIAGQLDDVRPLGELSVETIKEMLDYLGNGLGRKNGLKPDAVRRDIQKRMSDMAGFICNIEDVPVALEEARQLRLAINTIGLGVDAPNQAANLIRWRHMALVSEAVLASLAEFLTQGGGSRGARAICAANGSDRVDARDPQMADIRFIPEKKELNNSKILVQLREGKLQLTTRPLRGLKEPLREFFEKSWPDFLTGQYLKH